MAIKITENGVVRYENEPNVDRLLFPNVEEGISSEQIKQDVDEWLEDHPEATTTVVDGSITKAKLDADLNESIDEIDDLKAELYDVIEPSLEIGTIDTAGGNNTPNTNMLRTVGYISNVAVNLFFQNCKVRVYAYTSDGTYVGGYSDSEGYTKDWSKFTRLTSPVNIATIKGNDPYFYRLAFDQFIGDVTAENAKARLEINVLKDLSNKVGEKYTVGASGDFKTFTEMLVALKDNTNKKTVYVYDGTYDIFEEMGGAEFISSLDTSKNWRDVNNVVPPNTTIIGMGNVTLLWSPTDEQIIDQAHAFLMSPLNLSGTCTIKNINVICSNGRYAIHDETSGKKGFDGIERILENVNCTFLDSTFGGRYAYGSGHNKNSKYHYKNCTFSGVITPYSTHDWPAALNENSSFVFDNCVFKNITSGNKNSVRFSSTDTVGRLDDVKLNGCVLSVIVFSTERTANVKQGYKVQTMLCESYTTSYTSYIQEADRIAPVDYLALP